MQCSSNDFEWTPDTIARLRSLWSEGHSTAEIGRRLGASKNAVVGKAHRLNLPTRASPIRPKESGEASRPRRERCPSLAELQNLPNPGNVAKPSIVRDTVPVPTDRRSTPVFHRAATFDDGTAPTTNAVPATAPDLTGSR